MRNFRKLREKCGMSQQQVRKELGVSVGTIVNWDHGGGTTPEMKNRICRLFNCTREEL